MTRAAVRADAQRLTTLARMANPRPAVQADPAQVRAQHLLNTPIVRDPQAEAKVRDDVRRIHNRHDCPGECDRPEHARDVAAALEILQALGLAPSDRRATKTGRCPTCLRRRRLNSNGHLHHHDRYGDQPCKGGGEHPLPEEP
ncbi:hypothetical protein ACQEU3_47110 [Spirillospora sp. CA-253888]